MATNAPQKHYQILAKTQAEEDAYDITKSRQLEKPSGPIASIAQMVKAALGSGILSAHVAYKVAGGYVGLIMNMMLGSYMCFCLLLLGQSAHIMYRRTRIPYMTYPELGEAALQCSHSTTLKKLSKYFKVFMSAIIGCELFGACASYQLVMAGTIKQIVDNVNKIDNSFGLHTRYYVMMIWIPCVLICLIRHLQWLAPFSMVGNALVATCVLVTMYYSLCVENPTISGLIAYKDIEGVFTFLGMIVFSMSCSSQIMSIENNMSQPNKYAISLIIGHFGIVGLVCLCGFFGYSAYLEDSQPPITFNFPMETLPKILKIGVAIMIYVTHGLNFWIPFNTTFSYIKRCTKPERHLFWEYVLRPTFVTAITLIAIIFPNIPALVSFLGCFCLSNLSFMIPNFIYLLVVYERPGFGVMKWRLLRGIVFLALGMVLFFAGSGVALKKLVNVIQKGE